MRIVNQVARLASGTAIFFCASAVALPQELKIADIAVPPELGYVIEARQSTGPAPHPLIVHIQEAHVNYEAQKRLATILEQLIQQHGLKLILVEGGHGNVGLEEFRQYGPPQTRQQVAERYLKSGVLSGEEYLDITSNYPLMLWGIEDEGLYQENVNAFLDTEDLRASLQPIIAEVRASAEALKPRLFDPALTEVQAATAKFENGTMELSDYANLLSRTAQARALSQETYPMVARFVNLNHVQAGLQPTVIQQEQTALLQQLHDQISATEWEHLMDTARHVNEKTQTQAAFYQQLEQLTRAAGISTQSYPQLAQYLYCLHESAQIESAILAEELNRFAQQLGQELTSTPQSRALHSLLEEVDLVEKFLALRLTAVEYQRLQACDVAAMVPRWKETLTEQLAQYGFPPVSLTRLEELAGAWPSLQRFYDAARQRDEALVEQAIAKLDETHEPLAVLITGGFHSARITERLAQHGMNVVVMATRVDHPTDDRLYSAVMRYKSGQGTFEAVQTAMTTMTTQFAADHGS